MQLIEQTRIDGVQRAVAEIAQEVGDAIERVGDVLVADGVGERKLLAGMGMLETKRPWRRAGTGTRCQAHHGRREGNGHGGENPPPPLAGQRVRGPRHGTRSAARHNQL